MSNYKVVRNAAGELICFGPNTNQYGPGIPAGATLFIEENVPTNSLRQAKEEKLASLEASRKQAVATLPPVTVAAKQYPADSDYREIIANLARRSAAGKPIPGTLRGADGVPVALTAPLLGSIDDALAGAVNAQYDKWGTKFDAVQAATTVEAVNAVVW